MANQEVQMAEVHPLLPSPVTVPPARFDVSAADRRPFPIHFPCFFYCMEPCIGYFLYTAAIMTGLLALMFATEADNIGMDVFFIMVIIEICFWVLLLHYPYHWGQRARLQKWAFIAFYVFNDALNAASFMYSSGQYVDGIAKWRIGFHCISLPAIYLAYWVDIDMDTRVLGLYHLPFHTYLILAQAHFNLSVFEFITKTCVSRLPIFPVATGIANLIYNVART